MEELHSTAGLDEQIYADARRKAEKILANAETESKSLLEGVETRVLEARQKAEEESRSRISIFEKNVDSSLPLERQRYKISYIHNSVVSQINTYLKSLPEEKQLEIIQSLVEKSKAFLGGKDVTVFALNLKKADVEKMVKASLGNVKVDVENAEPHLLLDEHVEGLDEVKGVLIKTSDGKLTCRCTLDEKIKEILDTKMEELATTLFGGRIPE